MKIYLSGPIYTGNTQEEREATDKWREEVTGYFRNYSHQEFHYSDKQIFILDPCRKKAIYDPKLFTPNEIVFRDLKDVDDSDLIFVNIDLVGNKLPIGTVMEIMYAWIHKKPVVIVSKDPRILNHPWLIAMSVRMFVDIKEACEYTVEFWT